MLKHIPVLLQPALHYLNITPGCRYIDATFGGGGHTMGILAQGGKVLGLDQDRDAIEALEPALASNPNLTLVHSNFTHLTHIARTYNWRPVSGVLFDLGLSSHHLDSSNRGFSFQSSGPLDMRMDQSQQLSALDLVNDLPVQQLAHIFQVFGELTNAQLLATEVIKARPITTTSQLAAITKSSSRQAFQALRIAVNDELGVLQSSLPQAYDLLASGGRLVVISFHSLEDRLVEQFFQSSVGQVLTPKPIIAEVSEVTHNPRAKSAKLRAFIKK